MRYTRQEVYNLIAQGKDKKEIAKILNISLRSVERYLKEYDNITTKNCDKKATTTKERKRKREVAKSLILSGASLKETSEKTGVNKSTLANISSRDNLQKLQLEYLKSFRDELLKEITENKTKRFNINTMFLNELEGQELSRQTQELILLNEKTEQEILELTRIERLERLELNKKELRAKQIEEIKNELNNLSDEDLKILMELIDQKNNLI